MLRGCICGVSDALMNGAPVQCNIAGWEGAGREGGLGIGGRQLGNGFVQKIRQQEPPTRAGAGSTSIHPGPAPCSDRAEFKGSGWEMCLRRWVGQGRQAINRDSVGALFATSLGSPSSSSGTPSQPSGLGRADTDTQIPESDLVVQQT